jgi:hypothetical protein
MLIRLGFIAWLRLNANANQRSKTPLIDANFGFSKMWLIVSHCGTSVSLGVGYVSIF